MNSSRSSHKAGAFTLVELLCVIAIIGILAALILSAVNQSEARAKGIRCVNHLRQTGIAFQMFVHDHGDKFPMAVPLADGGSLEFVQNGYAVGGEFFFSCRQFQVLSNELSTPAILICPTDTRLSATDFGVLQNSNLSYFIGVKAGFSNPDSILAGDRNLTANFLPNPSILHLEADNPLRWTRELHQFKGNILFADGHVEEWNQAALAGAASQQAGADLFMPTVLPGPNVSAPASGGYGNYPGANPGVGALPPTPSATPTPPATPAPPSATPAPLAPRPANTSSGSQGGFNQQTPGQPGTQNLPDMARKNTPDVFPTNMPDGGTVTPVRTDSATLTFDQRVVKILRGGMIGFYLLIWLILLLWLLLAWWRRSQRKKMQRAEEL
jgi:prepilin-type processing-associated H-X9-DG protein/prepilin-type N-terminal cleavage/methylation domain-containing protein